MRKRLVLLFVIFVIFKIINCLQVIPERSNVTYQNSKYIEDGRFYIKRYGRKSGYYINLAARIKVSWTNNVTINLIFNEYLHNEYRRSFIEFHYKFCDILSMDPYVGGMLAKHGLTCPLTVNYYHLQNMTAQTDEFPNVFPFEKGRVDINIVVTKTGESIAQGYLCAIFKNNKKL